MRRASKRDTAEAGIVEALEAAGVSVFRLSRPVDLLWRYRGRIGLMEVKTPLTYPDARQRAQRAFIAEWEVPICRTPQEALRAVGCIKA